MTSGAAEQASPGRDGAVGFTVTTTAIPAGVRCGGCGRLHLPRRLRPLAGPTPEEVTLRCPRCGNRGTLAVDTEDPDQLAIRDAIVGTEPGETPR